MDEKCHLTSTPIYFYKFHINETPLCLPGDQKKVALMLKAKWTICLLSGFHKFPSLFADGKIASLRINMQSAFLLQIITKFHWQVSMFQPQKLNKDQAVALLSFKERSKERWFKHGVCNVKAPIAVKVFCEFYQTLQRRLALANHSS